MTATTVTDEDVRARVERLLAEHADDDMTTFLGAAEPSPDAC